MKSKTSPHPSSTLIDDSDFSPPPNGGQDSYLVPPKAKNYTLSYMNEEAHTLEDSDLEVLDVLRWSNNEVTEVTSGSESDVELTHATVATNSSRQKKTTSREWQSFTRKRRSRVRSGDRDLTVVDVYLPNRIHAQYGSEPHFVNLDEEDDMQEASSIVDLSFGDVEEQGSGSDEHDSDSDSELLDDNGRASGLQVRRIAECPKCCGELPPYVAGAVAYPVSVMLRAMVLQYQGWHHAAKGHQGQTRHAHIHYDPPGDARKFVFPPPLEPVSPEPLLNEAFRAHAAQWAASPEARTVYPSSVCHPALRLREAHQLAQECPIVVRRITDRAHPCYNARGAFATRDICVDAHEPFSLFAPSQNFPFFDSNADLAVLGAYLGVYRGALIPLAVHTVSVAGRQETDLICWDAMQMMREWCVNHGHALAERDWHALFRPNYQLTLFESPAITPPPSAGAAQSVVEQSRNKKDKCGGAEGRASATKSKSQGANAPKVVRTAWALDARRFGGPERYLNDYRGISFAPNCVFQLVRDSEKDIPRMLIFPIRPIAAGEELLIDYGSTYIEHNMSKEQLVEIKKKSKLLLREEIERRKNAQKLRADAPPLPGDALTGVELYASVGVDCNWMAPDLGWDSGRMFDSLEEDRSAGVVSGCYGATTTTDGVEVRKRSVEWDTDSESDFDVLLPID